MAFGERPDQSFCASPWTIGHYAATFTDYRHGNRRLQGHQPMIRISLWRVLALGMSTVMTCQQHGFNGAVRGCRRDAAQRGYGGSRTARRGPHGCCASMTTRVLRIE